MKYDRVMANGKFGRDEVLPSEKVLIHFVSMQIGLQLLVSYPSGRQAV